MLIVILTRPHARMPYVLDSSHSNYFIRLSTSERRRHFTHSLLMDGAPDGWRSIRSWREPIYSSLYAATLVRVESWHSHVDGWSDKSHAMQVGGCAARVISTSTKFFDTFHCQATTAVPARLGRLPLAAALRTCNLAIFWPSGQTAPSRMVTGCVQVCLRVAFPLCYVQNSTKVS